MDRIYIVEDDESIRKLVIYALRNQGFECEGFENGKTFFASLDKLPDCVLLDIMLPDMDGISILKRLRELPSSTDIPVMMLTAKSSEFDKVNALDLGADDYLTKPFGVMELLSRVRALLRRAKKSLAPDGSGGSSLLRFGPIEMNLQRHQVLVEGEETPLTYKEFSLLQYLLQNVHIVLTRDQLMERVWGFDYGGESRTVDMHIKSLRQKLKSAGSLIQTVRGVGYKIESKEEQA